MSSTTQLTGILGGTFDPVHSGHLNVAQQLIDLNICQKITFLPCYQNVLRSKPKANDQQRVAMLKLATINNPHFNINTIEMDQKKPCYTIDTLKTIRQKTFDPLALIIGTDLLATFNQWDHWEEILNYCHIIIVKRPGYPISSATWLSAWLSKNLIVNENELHSNQQGKIYIAEINKKSAASTTVRQQISDEKNLKDLLPNSVKNYIKQQNLYGQGTN